MLYCLFIVRRENIHLLLGKLWKYLNWLSGPVKHRKFHIGLKTHTNPNVFVWIFKKNQTQIGSHPLIVTQRSEILGPLVGNGFKWSGNAWPSSTFLWFKLFFCVLLYSLNPSIVAMKIQPESSPHATCHTTLYYTWVELGAGAGIGRRVQVGGW